MKNMIIIDEDRLNNLIAEAKASPRLRMNFNLHDSLEAKAQRLLNAVEPGTVLPIHRHRHTAETYLLLKGKIKVKVYNEDKTLKETYLLALSENNYGLHIPANCWNTVEVIESSVILEVKDGPYMPITEEDILK